MLPVMHCKLMSYGVKSSTASSAIPFQNHRQYTQKLSAASLHSFDDEKGRAEVELRQFNDLTVFVVLHFGKRELSA